MDAIDILGSILGRKSKSKTSGGSILKDIFGDGTPPAQQESRGHQHNTGSSNYGGQNSGPRGSRYDFDDSDAESLEEMLRVSRHHNQQRRGNETTPQNSGPAVRIPERNTKEFQTMNEQSEVLVRAMVNAAKSDGEVDKAEQDLILREMDHVTQDELNFLRSEFQKKLDVREFAWSIPLGMEQKVYSVSLMAIDLDQQKEAKYLVELAHGLRIPPEVCNQIHRRFNAPELFRT